MAGKREKKNKKAGALYMAEKSELRVKVSINGLEYTRERMEDLRRLKVGGTEQVNRRIDTALIALAAAEEALRQVFEAVDKLNIDTAMEVN